MSFVQPASPPKIHVFQLETRPSSPPGPPAFQLVLSPGWIRPWHDVTTENHLLVQSECDQQCCEIFFAAYGQNPDKKRPKWLFFEKVMAKTTKCFNYGKFHIHRCLKLFGKQYIFCQKNVVLPKKQFFP